MDRQITIDGKRIYYRVTGMGRSILLVHGFGETGEVWQNQVNFLRDKYRLIVPDLPGSGQSDPIDDMSMEGMAEVLKRILVHENHSPDPNKSVVLVGHSMGGYISLAFAEKYDTWLNGFGLFHSTAFSDNEEKKANRRKGIEFINEHGTPAFLKNTSPNLFSPITKAENQALIDDFMQGLNNFSAASLVSYYEAMMNRPDRSAILTKLKIPVLFIMGQYDTAVPLEDGLKLCSLPEISYIHNLRKSGHMGMLEEADFSNEILDKFFEGT